MANRVGDDTTSEEASLVPRVLRRGQIGLGALRKYESIAERSLRTVLESDIFEHPFPLAAWHCPDIEWLLLGRPRLGRSISLGEILVSSRTTEPHYMWHLFWALSESSQRFVSQYIQFWSHEERLTGHLITELLRGASGYSDHFDASVLRGRVGFYYADVAARSMEASTGADFALIVHSRTSDGAEHFKVARFQAKKVGPNGKARIDLAQQDTLRQIAGLGYYVFYYAADARGALLPPSVVSAAEVLRDSSIDRKNQKSASWEARNASCCELATFIVFGLGDAINDCGVLAKSAHEASALALHGGNEQGLPPPSRAVVLSVGSVPSHDWYALLGGPEAFAPSDEE